MIFLLDIPPGSISFQIRIEFQFHRASVYTGYKINRKRSPSGLREEKCIRYTPKAPINNNWLYEKIKIFSAWE